MRVLFASTAGAGHIGPLVPLAQACRDAGHDVQMAVPERARAAVEARGLLARTHPDLDPTLRAEFERTMRVEQSREAANVQMTRELFGRLNATCTLPFMQTIIDDFRPDVVVREPFEPASWLAADAAGVPTVMVPCATWRSMPFVAKHMHAGIEALADELGISSSPDPAQNAKLIASATPASLELEHGVPPDVVRLAPVEARVQGSASDRRRVFVTFGTVAGHIPGMLSRVGPVVCEALRELDMPAVFALGRGVDPSLLGPVPDDVEVRDYVSLPEVLATSSLIICHGGYGTTMAALGAGVPVLGMPLFSYDQWHTTALVADAGAGRSLELSDQTAEVVRDSIHEMLSDPEIARRSTEIADEMAAHTSCADVASDLERYLLD